MRSINWKYMDKWHYGNIESEEYEDLETMLFRYSTNTTLAGGMMPLVKVDKLKMLIYFLTERSLSGAYPYPEFEIKGCKCFFD